MNYNETIKYIHNTPKFSRTLGNDLLRKLLKQLGDPQNKLKFVHIAGTNGKGSAAIMLSEILIRAGYSVGLFTSPFIERFNERIKFNGKEIPDSILAEIGTKIRNVIEKSSTPVSEFALITAIAFEYFNTQNCDIVILETGLGGRLDATNVIEKSLISVLMSIDKDHTEYLGNTIEEITAEKCGIIKPNGTVVVYPIQYDKAKSVIQSFCTKNNAKLVYAKTPTIIDATSFMYDGKKYSLSLSGDFQRYNAATVIETVNELNTMGFSVTETDIRDGLLAAFNPARLELLKCGLILDGAHNTQAMRALCNTLSKYDKPIFVCIAMMQDKDISSCISELAKINPNVIITELNMPRCAPANTILNEFRKHNIEARIIKDPLTAAKTTLKSASQQGTAVACGSLYLVGELRKNLK